MQTIETPTPEDQRHHDESSLLYMGDNTDDLTEAVIADAWEDDSEAWDSIR